ncbi:streptomycin 6-kinase [Naumannella cuiyingiana]|uniref:Streptomycin 6-kinase n=1 Tax=Naumannella cuiyingiana TaxID=1347891 RepID=A0A7Z0D7G1_9ACTN|nr:streptomycin 6-kinase [Naumannella cuiyingiana]
MSGPGSFAAAEVPRDLAGHRELGEGWPDWLDRLPRLAADLLAEWELTRDGAEVWHGFGSLVLPVRDRDGVPGVFKIAYDGDDEGLHEALGLQRWAGNGAVRLLRADPRRRALLLERLHRRDLGELWDVEACEIVAGLYAKLHVPAGAPLQLITDHVARWLDDLARLPRDAPIPRRHVEQALALGRELVADPASTGVIIHGDLHYANVLAADRAPWLAIDPKPMSGDPHYEPAPMLWNRFDELGTGAALRYGLRTRLETLVDAAGLDHDRARDWVIVRMIINAHWSIQDAERAGRSLNAEEREWITRCITIAKSVQD